MLFVELYIEFADTIIVCHGCDGVRKINIGKLSDLTYFIGRLNEARLILGGEEELKERGERERESVKFPGATSGGEVARPVKFYCRTRRPPNEFAWKFAVRTENRVVRINRVTCNEQRKWIQRGDWTFRKDHSP